jgi:hypothetical protein
MKSDYQNVYSVIKNKIKSDKNKIEKDEKTKNNELLNKFNNKNKLNSKYGLFYYFNVKF